MESPQDESVSTPLMKALQRATTAVTTIVTSSLSGTTPLNSSVHGEGHAHLLWNGSHLVTNHSLPSTENSSSEAYLSDLPVLRIVCIVSVLTFLVLLAWGSYSLQKRCSSHRKRTKYYKSTLLL